MKPCGFSEHDGRYGVERLLDRLARNEAAECAHDLSRDIYAAGVYPQQFISKLHVDVAVRPGATKGSAGPVRFHDCTICEGALGEMIEGAVTAIA